MLSLVLVHAFPLSFFSLTLLVLLKVEVSITLTLAQLRLANTFRLSDPGRFL